MIDSGLELRSRQSRPADGGELTNQQRRILTEIEKYVEVTGEPCGGRYIARRMRLHHSTVQEHLERLHRKGWLRGPSSPAMPRPRGAK